MPLLNCTMGFSKLRMDMQRENHHLVWNENKKAVPCELFGICSNFLLVSSPGLRVNQELLGYGLSGKSWLSLGNMSALYRWLRDWLK